MGKHPENAWKARLKKDLEALNGVVLSVHGHAMQAPGWPDLYVAHSRWSGWIELKMPRGSLSGIQVAVGKKLARHDIWAMVTDHGDFWTVQRHPTIDHSTDIEPSARALLKHLSLGG